MHREHLVTQVLQGGDCLEAYDLNKSERADRFDPISQYGNV
jgi:hypothetical protein